MLRVGISPKRKIFLFLSVFEPRNERLYCSPAGADNKICCLTKDFSVEGLPVEVSVSAVLVEKYFSFGFSDGESFCVSHFSVGGGFFAGIFLEFFETSSVPELSTGFFEGSLTRVSERLRHLSGQQEFEFCRQLLALETRFLKGGVFRGGSVRGFLRCLSVDNEPMIHYSCCYQGESSITTKERDYF